MEKVFEVKGWKWDELKEENMNRRKKHKLLELHKAKRIKFIFP